MLPYFRKSENVTTGDDAFGARQPLGGGGLPHHPALTHQFVAAAQEAGFAFNPDIGARRSGATVRK